MSVAGEKNIEVKVGLLVAICLGLLVTFIIVLGGVGSATGATLFLDVDTSATLKTGAPVKIAGVAAGKVAAVDYRGGEVDPKVGRPVFVRVTLTVDADKIPTLKRASRFYITNQGVLGEKYVEIDPVSVQGPSLAPNDVVLGEPPMRLEVMAANASRVLSTLSDVLRRNEKALDDLIVNAADAMATVKRAVDRVDTLVATVGPKVDTVLTKASSVEDEVLVALRGVNAVIGDGSEMRGLVRNASGLAADVRVSIPPLVSKTRDAIARFTSVGDKADALLADVGRELGQTAEAVRAVLSDAKTLTQRLKDGQGTIGALLSDRETYDDLREMMKDLKRHPWKFIWKE